MKRNFSLNLSIKIAFSFLFAATFFSCEVGLGEAVDTEKPNVTIENPTAASVIRDIFTMSGECSDETGLKSVTVTLRNTSTNVEYPAFTAEIDSVKKSWECKINPLDSTNPIPDGSYEATALATDNSGRESTQTKAFKIDNTAPVLVLTRPSTKVTDDSFDSYGTEFDITGQAADDNNIEKLVISVYTDKNFENKIGEDITLKNVAPTVDLTCARWDTSLKDTLHEKYTSIYGTDKTKLTQNFYVKIKVFDEARHCPSVTNDEGNSTDEYYLFNDIYSDLLKTYKVTQIYQILSGSYTISESGDLESSASATENKVTENKVSEELSALKESVQKTLSKYALKGGSFSLNPENSPTYNFSDLDKLSGTASEKYALITKENSKYVVMQGGSGTVSFSSGLDKTPLVKGSLGFYLKPYKQTDGVWNVSEDESERIWVVKPYTKVTGEDGKTEWTGEIDVSDVVKAYEGTDEYETKKAEALKFYNEKRDSLVTKGSYDIVCTTSFTVSDLLPVAAGTVYSIVAVGQDENGNEFVNKDEYAFQLVSSGSAPSLELTAIDETKTPGSTYYIKKEGFDYSILCGMKLSGTVTADDVTTVKITITDKAGKEVKFDGETIATESFDKPAAKKWELSVPLKYFTSTPTDLTKAVSARYTLTVTATAGSKSTEKTIDVGYDADGPVVEIVSVSPYASSTTNESETVYTVNGTFKIKVSASDDFYKLSEDTPITLEIKNDASSIYSFTTSDSNFERSVNSRTELTDADKKDLTICVTAYDYAGNKTVTEQKIYLDQDSDKPVVKLTNVVLEETKEDGTILSYKDSYPTGGTQNLILAGASFNANISDDDGLKKIEVILYNENNEKASSKEYTLDSSDAESKITSNPYLLTYTVPSDIGTYHAVITVTDTENETVNDECKFYFVVDNGKPTISIDNNGTLIGKPGASISVSGKTTGIGNIQKSTDGGKNWKVVKENTPASETAWTDTIEIPSDATESSTPSTVIYKITDSRERSAQKTVEYYVDSTAPIVTVTAVSGGLVESTTYKFTGTAKDNVDTTGKASGLKAIYYKFVSDSESSTVNSPSSQEEATTAGWSQLSGISENWSVTQDFAEKSSDGVLAEGKYTLYAVAFDEAGNVSNIEDSSKASFSVDLNAPSVSTCYYTTDNAQTTEIKNSSSVSVTVKPYTIKISLSDTFALNPSPLTVKVTKTADDGETDVTSSFTVSDVTFTDSNTKKEATATVCIKQNDDGSSVTQDDGTYTYEITAVDENNKKTTVTRTIILDTTGPVIEVTSPDSNEWITTLKNTISVKGSASDDNGVKKVFYSTTQQTQLPSLKDGMITTNGWTEIKGTTSWTISELSLNAGENAVYFTALDVYGNATTVKDVTFKYDGEAPSVQTQTLTKYTVTNTDGTETATESGNETLENGWSGYVNGSVNKIKLTLKAKDNLNLQSVQVSVTKNNETSSTNWKDAETTAINKTDSTWEKEFYVGSSYNTKENYLKDGVYKVLVTVTDVSGQTCETSWTFTVDTVAPGLGEPTLSPEDSTQNAVDGWYNVSTANLSVTPSDATSGISGVYYLVSDTKIDADKVASATIDTPVTKSGNSYLKKLTLSEGNNFVYLKVEDNAGNVTYRTDALTFNVDKTGPVLKFETPDTSNMLSNKVEQSVRIVISDALSGITEGSTATSTATVSLVSDSTDDEKIDDKSVSITKDTSSGSDVYVITCTYLKEDMAKIAKGNSAKLSVKASDKVGNKKEEYITLTFDNTPPTVSITNPAASSVNGTISISGIASDSVGLSYVKLYRTKLSSETAQETDITVDSTTYCLIKTFNGTEAYNWSVNSFDTSKLTDGTKLTLYVIASDTAGNTSTATKEITVDQDSDRPEIKFNNLSLANMSSSSYVMNKAETIYGNVTDDDGVSEMYISVDGGMTWSDNIYDGGSWSYTFTKNGKATLAFKVKDAAGKDFVSSSDESKISTSPKLYDAKQNKIGYKKEDGKYDSYDTYLYLQTDTQNPVLTPPYYILSETDLETDNTAFTEETIKSYSTSTLWQISDGLKTAGGKKKYLYVLFKATDSSGIKGITASLGDVNGTQVKKLDDSTDTENPYSIYVYSFDAGTGNGTVKLTYKATDNADRTTDGTISLSLDNTAPVIKITSHKDGNSVYGSSTTNLRGTTDDCEKLYLKVTSSSTAPKANFGSDSSDSTQWEEIDQYTSTGSWSVIFGTGNNNSGNIDYYAGTLNGYYDELFDPKSSDKTSTSKQMYLWLYGEDSLGNVSTPSGIYLNVNPQGDQPTVSVSYPTATASVGGTIRITGSSEIAMSSVTVDKIYVQIDPSYDASAGFASDWQTKLTTLLGGDDAASTYGIKATGITEVGSALEASGSTASWNLTINSSREFNTNDNSNRSMAIRVWAYSSSKKLSEPVVIPFTLDPNSPVIGNSKELYVVQYKDDTNFGTVTKKQKFEDNMWLSGQWYLTGSIEDDSGISLVKWNGTEITSRTDLLKADSGTELMQVSSGDYKNYTFSIPVGNSETDSCGILTYTLFAQEGSSDKKDVEATYTIQYDNKAPDLKGTDASYKNELSATGLMIVQSNGTYTINGTVNEDSVVGTSGLSNQSGFGKVVMFFTRTLNDVAYVVDPMLSSGTSGMANAFKQSDLTQIKGIWCKSHAFTYSSDTQKLTIIDATDSIEDFIRTGSLCRIDDVDYIVNAVDYTNKTVTLKTSLPTDTTGGTAYFAIAQIIDNTVMENGTTTVYNKNGTANISNDDGDQMVEGVTQSGTTYKWTASIDSTLILDGSIALNLVACDQAGNYSSVKTYSGNVSNNSPRIAGVMFGNDDNNDGVVSEAEMVNGYSGIYTSLNNNGIRNGYITQNQIANNVTIPTSAESDGSYKDVINIKGAFAVRPEIVGGNHGIGYTYSVTRNNSSIYSVTDVTELTNVHSTGDTVRPTYNADTATGGVKDITISLIDMVTNSLTDGANTVFNFTFWDYTDGAIAGKDSNKANLKIYTNVCLYDNESPTVSISPFYWKSSSDNSVYYENTTAKGHIELEADWKKGASGYSSTATSGISDGDPKVSGIIKIQGTASDNAMIKELYLTFPGHSKLGSGAKVAEYVQDSSSKEWSWTENGTLDIDGYKTQIETVSLSNTDGHKINWTVYVDTAKITNVAQADVSVTAKVVDRGKLTATTTSGTTTLSYTERTDTTNPSAVTSAVYKMDVVPYITSLYTGISNTAGQEFARSATGKYSVRAGETITMYGFNLKADTNNVTIGSDTVTTTDNSDKTGLKFTVGTSAVSSDVSITVNSITSLNNMNANPTFKSATDDTITANEYNSQANGVTNNRLTDDVSLYVWNMGSFLQESGKDVTDITSPMLKMDSNGNYYMSYGYGVPSMYVNKNGTTRQIDYSYNKFHNTNVAFDDNGNTYAVATNTDRVGDYSAKFVFYTPYSGAMPNAVGSNSNSVYQSYSNSKRHLEQVYNEKTGKYDINRVKRPKITTVTSGSTTYIGLVYYDYNNTESPVKFRFGSKTGTTIYGGIAGNVAQSSIGGQSNNPSTTDSSYKDYHIVAKTSFDHAGGEYAACGIIPDSSVSDGYVAVVAWYDASARSLCYSYNTSPNTAVSGGVWQTNAKVLDSNYAGWYVDLCTDADGGIHIAYYNSAKGDLKYVYLSSYAAEPTTPVTIDSYLSVGTNITVNTRKETVNSASRNVPYIYYYNASSNQTPNSIKVAWQKDSTLSNGAVNDKFTGSWESMTIPSENIPQDATVCGGVPNSNASVSEYAGKVVLGYMTDARYEKAVLTLPSSN